MPAKAADDMQYWGQNATEMQKMLIERSKYEGIFHEYDLAYLDGAQPEKEPPYGVNANYRLLPPRNQNLCITIYMERIVKDRGAE
jgi:hypothetical protein